MRKLDIFTISDLLEYYPRNYIDKTNIIQICNIESEGIHTIRAKIITPIQEHKVGIAFSLFKFKISDNTGIISVTLFNQKYLAKSLKQYDEFVFYGKVTYSQFGIELNSPDIEQVNFENECGNIKAIYKLSKEINNNAISKLVTSALEYLKNANITEYLSEDIVNENNLIDVKTAITKIHRPKNLEDITIARKRLVFDELLKLSISLRKIKQKKKKFTAYKIKDVSLNEFTKLLPFELTNAQKRVINECVKDLKLTTPMSRLVQGDVASGKTIVVAALMYLVSKNGMQSCLMAPTEILANQHYKSISPILEKLGIKTILITGSMTKKHKLLAASMLKDGAVSVAIGTHALLEEYVEFNNLAFVATDEQHRFGVNQRAKLANKSHNPHVLVMSATPIPRTLALVIYADLDISVIDEMPAQRGQTRTYLADENKRDRVYNFVAKEAKNGTGAYIVCPLVEEGDTDELKSVKELFENASKKYFGGINCGFIYGKMSGKEKENVMNKFANEEIKILFATTVIEVGINVKSANIMVIENAERFGLSQLHQLRGRIGRGDSDATLVLLHRGKSADTVDRLSMLCSTTDGFKISEYDLSSRGAGDFFGQRQHGEIKLKIANLSTDIEILKLAINVANNILDDDENLAKEKNRSLKSQIERILKTDSTSIFS